MDPNLVTPILLAALVAWGIVRRLRRTFGRQPVQVARIWFRIGILTLAAGLVVWTGAQRDAQTLAALIAGFLCGAALAYFGLRHTRFEVTPEGRFYTPHTYIGLAVTALLLGRLLYRLFYLSYGSGAMAGANQNLAVTYQRNPLTLGIFAVLVSYYVLFYAGVLARNRAGAPPTSEGASPGA